jgi:hypothetical protein
VEEKQTGADRRLMRLEGVVMIIHIFTAIGVYTVGMCFVRIVLALMGDRTGNSGRYRRWDQEDD